MKRRFSKILLPAIACFLIGNAAVGASERVRLFVKEVPLKVLGKEVTVIAIEQADGTHGYSPEKNDGFHVEVVNQLKVPTSIHWHGLILPNLMDGVPFVTQNPIAPGKSFGYDFPLKQSGTYWMHSHYGLQEQLYNSAPLIIWTPEERAKADRQVVVMLSDFSFTPPEQILRGLKGGMQMASKKQNPAKKKWTLWIPGKCPEAKATRRRSNSSLRSGTIRSKGLFEQRCGRPKRTLTLNTMPSLQTVARLMTRQSFLFMLENPYCSASSLRPPARIFMSTLEDWKPSFWQLMARRYSRSRAIFFSSPWRSALI
jgi:hypothetical protein